MTSTKIHWLTPSLMCASLVSGSLIAMGHHIYYASLDRLPVSTLEDHVQLLGSQVSRQANAPGYMSWSPWAGGGRAEQQSLIPFVKGDMLSAGWALNTRRYQSFQGLGGEAPVMVAVIPALLQVSLADANGGCSAYNNVEVEKIRAAFKANDTTILRCDVYNSTYTTHYSFVNGTQTVDVDIRDLSNFPVPQNSEVQATLRDEAGTAQPCDVLTELNTFNDQGRLGGPGDVVYWEGNSTAINPCHFNATVLDRLSYLAITDAFASLLNGKISVVMDYESSLSRVVQTDVLSTSLVRAFELDVLNDPATYLNRQTLQGVGKGRQTIFTGLTKATHKEEMRSLQQVLEELFTNITVSLMGSPELQPAAESAWPPVEAEVAFTVRENIYFYAVEKLWLAYGLAIAATTSITAVGLICIYHSRASMSDDFSTILRLVLGVELSKEVAESDLDGRDPLPDNLRHSSIRFSFHKRANFQQAGYAMMEMEDFLGQEALLRRDVQETSPNMHHDTQHAPRRANTR